MLVWIETWQAACRTDSHLSPRRSKSDAWERCLGQAALRRPNPNNPCLMLVKHLYCSEEKTPTVLNVHCTGLMFDSTFVWIFTNKLAGPNAMKIVNKSSQTQANSNRHVEGTCIRVSLVYTRAGIKRTNKKHAN